MTSYAYTPICFPTSSTNHLFSPETSILRIDEVTARGLLETMKKHGCTVLSHGATGGDDPSRVGGPGPLYKVGPLITS